MSCSNSSYESVDALQDGSLLLYVGGYGNQSLQQQTFGGTLQQNIATRLSQLIVITFTDENGFLHVYTIGWLPLYYSLTNYCRVNIYLRLWHLVNITANNTTYVIWSEVINLPITLVNTGGVIVATYIPLHIIGMAIAEYGIPSSVSSGSVSTFNFYGSFLALPSSGSTTTASLIPSLYFGFPPIPVAITIGFSSTAGQYTVDQSSYALEVPYSIKCPDGTIFPEESEVLLLGIYIAGNTVPITKFANNYGFTNVGIGVNGTQLPIAVIVYFDTTSYFENIINPTLASKMNIANLIWFGISNSPIQLLPSLNSIFSLINSQLGTTAYPTTTPFSKIVTLLTAYGDTAYSYNFYTNEAFSSLPSKGSYTITVNGTSTTVNLVVFPSISQMQPITQSNFQSILSDINAKLGSTLSFDFGETNLTPVDIANLTNRISYANYKANCKQYLYARQPTQYEQCLSNVNNQLNQYGGTTQPSPTPNIPWHEIISIGVPIAILVGTGILAVFTLGSSLPFTAPVDIGSAVALGGILSGAGAISLTEISSSGLLDSLTTVTPTDQFATENSNIVQDEAQRNYVGLMNTEPDITVLEGSGVSITLQSISNNIASFDLTYTDPETGQQNTILLPTGVIDDYYLQQLGFDSTSNVNAVQLEWNYGQVILKKFNAIKSRLGGLLGILKTLLKYILIALINVVASLLIYYFLYYPSLVKDFSNISNLGSEQGGGTTTTTTTTVSSSTTPTSSGSSAIISSAVNSIASTFQQIPDILSSFPEQIASFVLLASLTEDLVNNLMQRASNNLTRSISPASKVFVEPQPFQLENMIKLPTLTEIMSQKGIVSGSQNFKVNMRARKVWQSTE